MHVNEVIDEAIEARGRERVDAAVLEKVFSMYSTFFRILKRFMLGEIVVEKCHKVSHILQETSFFARSFH